jgi:hypothetical protein
MKLALAIAPQHSSQYADMARRLAGPELRASPAGDHISAVETVELGGRPYLLATLPEHSSADELMPVLSRLGASAGVFEYFDQAAGLTGPFLRPLAPAFTPHLPPELAEARRYKGKTSEVFSQVLLNLAFFAGDYRDRLERRLRVLDPLAGGGTTLFVALAAGHDAVGIERGKRNVETTASFVREFCRESRISHSEVHEKAKRRYLFELGPRDDRRLLVLAEGDARSADSLLRDIPGGPRFHAIAADLPYGIQHPGDAAELLAGCAATWERTLLPGAAAALSWDATRLSRAAVRSAVCDHSTLTVREDGPYAELEHRVDRVIKRRDVLIAVKGLTAPHG